MLDSGPVDNIGDTSYGTRSHMASGAELVAHKWSR